MEVQIITQSCVQPSFPTPPHLKTYEVSLIDQFIKSNYIAVIFFYQNCQETNKDTQKISSLLKQSLPQTLTRFYPFAGKVIDTLTIDCNDEGVYYIEAKANISLSQYLNQRDSDSSLHKLKPDVCLDFDLPCGSHIALIQETTFACGGFSIAIYISHMIGDGASICFFMRDWAATTRNSPVQHPFLKGGSIFPQYAEFPTEASLFANIHAPFAKKGKIITKRIVFHESGIAKLKSKVSLNGVDKPTRSEVVTAILCKCLMASFKNKTGVDTPLAINIAVNLRNKVEPPIPECSVGNFLMLVGSVFPAKKHELCELVSQIRETVKKVDKDLVKKIREEGFCYYYGMVKELRDMYGRQGEAEFVQFSSATGIGFYEVDFGWGKPIWLNFGLPNMDALDLPSANTVVFLGTGGNAIEACLTIKEDEFDFLKKDPELLQYASIDHAPKLLASL